jgi:acyl-CoA synthetase (AMP-forming)/AMP-acid ligase II
MDNKLFLIDTNTITYLELLEYVNGYSNQNYTDAEIFILDTIKNLLDSKVIDVDDLIYQMYKSNKLVQLFTSGTTGVPKSVSHSFDNIVRNIKISDNRKEDIWGLCYQPNKMAGYQVLFQSLLNKNTLINMFGYNYNEIVKRISTFDVSHLSATPTMYKMILFNKSTFDHVKQVTLGGEGSTESFQKLLKKHFPNAKVKNVYASTEAGSLFASNGETFQIPVSDIKFIKVFDNQLYLHENILGKSESITFKNGWFCTGDLVEFVNETEFKILGRISNVIKVAGYNVNIESVENKIQNLDFVKLCKIHSKSNSVLGNSLICDIVLQNNVELIEIKKRLRSLLEKQEIPSKINLVVSIKMSENGKLKR